MADLTSWQWCTAPALKSTVGNYVRIDPVDFPGDGEALFAAIGGPENDQLWDFIPIGPFEDAQTLRRTFQAVGTHQNWQTHLLHAPDTRDILGMASYMRIRPEAGSAEIGCIVFSKKLQRSRAATEAMYLMAKHIFDDLGYRRYEWKCDNANGASKRAALRYGFTFEGIFRQDMVMKGRNRDTAWYAIIDSEWPRVSQAFEAWLSPENFDAGGVQRQSLAEIRQTIRD